MAQREKCGGVVMDECRWCNKSHVAFAKAHVIPKAFFNYDGKNNRVLISQHEIGKRRPKGSYDNQILCKDCESHLSQIDNEAAEILLNNFERKIIPFNDKRDEEAYQIDGKYFQSIKRFLIFVLWRASVSSLKEFTRVNLGPYEDRIRKELSERKFFEPDEYSFWASKILNPSGHFYPYKDKKEQGRTYYVIHLADYIFNLKIDSQRTPIPYDAFAYHYNIPFLKFERTPEGMRRAMVEVAKAHEKNFGQLKHLKIKE